MTIAPLVVALLIGGIVSAVTMPSADDRGGLNPIAHSVDAAAAAGSARFEFSIAFDVPGGAGTGDESLSFGGQGEMAFEPPAARMTMTFAGLPGPDEATSGFSMEMVVLGTEIFMKMPEEAAVAPTPWIKVDLTAIEGLEDLGQLEGLADQDPSKQLEYLRGASDDFEEIGPEPVRGVDTTHYRAVISLRKTVDVAPADQRDALRRMTDQLIEETGLDSLPMEVWIDDEGLPRRMRMEQDFASVPGAPSGASMSITMEFFDFGVDVDVEPPPDDQVTDMSELLAQFVPG
jgi:hypothetical protein